MKKRRIYDLYYSADGVKYPSPLISDTGGLEYWIESIKANGYELYEISINKGL